uniref:Uncharacterized protein n=1 Tax=uncultured Desulfobacterium sp. TaxID=201089 RepID=E1YAT1_9BACT|nr:unknown protein [uncultured Desulfobacterium sp.]
MLGSNPSAEAGGVDRGRASFVRPIFSSNLFMPVKR